MSSESVIMTIKKEFIGQRLIKTSAVKDMVPGKRLSGDIEYGHKHTSVKTCKSPLEKWNVSFKTQSSSFSSIRLSDRISLFSAQFEIARSRQGELADCSCVLLCWQFLQLPPSSALSASRVTLPYWSHLSHLLQLFHMPHLPHVPYLPNLHDLPWSQPQP